MLGEKLTEEKLSFYENLANLYDKCSTNGPKVLLGDCNARVGKRRPGEDDVLGEHGWGREAIKKVEISNRDLLMQFCLERELVVANTLEAGAPETKATFVEMWQTSWKEDWLMSKTQDGISL